jgi:hypothetical protein
MVWAPPTSPSSGMSSLVCSLHEWHSLPQFPKAFSHTVWATRTSPSIIWLCHISPLFPPWIAESSTVSQSFLSYSVGSSDVTCHLPTRVYLSFHSFLKSLHGVTS